MLRLVSCILATSLFLLAGCHSNAGYLSANPELTYGPGVVEFPDPVRAYVPGHAYGHGYVSTYGERVSASHVTSVRTAYRTPRDVEVIFYDYDGGSPPVGAGSGVGLGSAPAAGSGNGNRRVRRASGQPLGIDFVD